MQLPRLYLAWLTPALYAPGDAELDVARGVLTGGKNSRLYKRLVYDLQVAQDVSAFQASTHARIVLHDRRHRPAVAPTRPTDVLEKLKAIVDEELREAAGGAAGRRAKWSA